jgi:hypothetical protein
MTLKQALAIGLSSAILTLPAFAAESVTAAANLIPANTAIKQDAVKSMKKQAIHKKGHKKCLMKNNVTTKQAKENAQLNELNAINPSDAAKN